jgi:hypothetical protein
MGEPHHAINCWVQVIKDMGLLRLFVLTPAEVVPIIPLRQYG